MDPNIVHLIELAAEQYALPQDLLTAQVEHESSGDPWAFRYERDFFGRYIRGNAQAAARAYGPIAACSLGLMQIMVEVAYEMGFDGRPEELFDPATNLDFGAKKMRALWDAAGGTDTDYGIALAAYNGGPAWLHRPASVWTPAVKSYVDTVYSYAQRSKP